MLDFLKNLQEHGLLDTKNKSGLIVHADDQYVNNEALKMNLRDIGIAEKLVALQNGKDVVDYFDRMLSNLDQRRDSGERPL